MLHQEPCSKHPALSGHIRELQSDYESDDLSGKNWRRDFPFADFAPRETGRIQELQSGYDSAVLGDLIHLIMFAMIFLKQAQQAQSRTYL